MKKTHLSCGLMAAPALPAAASGPVWPDLAPDLAGRRPRRDDTTHIATDTPSDRTPQQARAHVRTIRAAAPGH